MEPGEVQGIYSRVNVLLLVKYWAELRRCVGHVRDRRERASTNYHQTHVGISQGAARDPR